MELNEFISKFASLFEDEDSSVFTADTDFHELDSWSSFTSLNVVAMIIQEFGVELDSQDVRNADTIADLFDIVKERQG
ncbi:MAG: acyl carrier protein [Bacteroidales bacterium]|nr:acyl carrier protein [Bacteroidales bacterium]